MSKIKQMPHVTVEQVLSLRDAAIKIEQERDELAAQVERLSSAAEKLTFVLVYDVPEWIPSESTHDAFLSLHDVMLETPPAALESLKAQWQAEAFNEAAAICEKLVGPYTYGVASDALYCASDKLIERAQEHNQ